MAPRPSIYDLSPEEQRLRRLYLKVKMPVSCRPETRAARRLERFTRRRLEHRFKVGMPVEILYWAWQEWKTAERLLMIAEGR